MDLLKRIAFPSKLFINWLLQSIQFHLHIIFSPSLSLSPAAGVANYFQWIKRNIPTNESYSGSRRTITAYCTLLKFFFVVVFLPLAHGRIKHNIFEWIVHMWLAPSSRHRCHRKCSENNMVFCVWCYCLCVGCNAIVLHRQPPYVTHTHTHPRLCNIKMCCISFCCSASFQIFSIMRMIFRLDS